MMRKRVVTFGAMVFVLVVAHQSEAQSSNEPPMTLRVQAVNGSQAVLTEVNTGVQTIVQVGDVIQGWTVAAITPSAVEIEREDPEQGRNIRARLPVGLGGVSGPSP